MAKAKPAEQEQKRPVGRPSDYSPELADKIIERISTSSDGLIKICQDDDMPSHSTVWRWADKDVDGFQERFARACARRVENKVEAMGEVAQGVLEGRYDPQAARVYADIIRWEAAKLAPKKYGDKLGLDHSGNVGVNITFDRADSET